MATANSRSWRRNPFINHYSGDHSILTCFPEKERGAVRVSSFQYCPILMNSFSFLRLPVWSPVPRTPATCSEKDEAPSHCKLLLARFAFPHLFYSHIPGQEPHKTFTVSARDYMPWCWILLIALTVLNAETWMSGRDKPWDWLNWASPLKASPQICFIYL